MGKVDPGIIEFSGKFGNTIIANSRKKKKFTRTVVAKGTKKHEAALKKQYSRTAALNKLAGLLNSEFKEFLRHYRRTDLYQYMQRLFRRADSLNRFVLLSQLRDTELSPHYRLHAHCIPRISFTPNSDKITCEVGLDAVPDHHMEPFNSYYFDLLLLQWESGKDELDAERKLSEWVRVTDPVPVFEFEFPRMKKAREWMMVFRIRWGHNKILQREMSASSARIVEVSSFNPQDIMQLEEARRQMKIKEAEKYGRDEVVEGERVRAKGR